MKYNRKNRAMVSGVMVGVASIYAVASYFKVDWSELGGFMLSTLLFVVGIVLLAVLAIILLKGAGALLGLLRRQSDDDSNKRE